MATLHDKDPDSVDTNGGAYVNRDVDTGGGDFVGRDKHVYGDEVYGDKVGTKIVYQGPAYPRLNYRSDIDGLITFYTQTFIGREDECRKIASFAVRSEPGYLLVEAEAGHGKSALMAHVIRRHETDSWGDAAKPNLLFFFIRHEGQRNSGVAFLQALNSEMLSMLDLSGGVPSDVTGLRAQFSELWSKAKAGARLERPLLVLIDGLDEMARGEPTIAQLLPPSLSPYVHVVVSARLNTAPLEQVPLEHPFKKASVLPLQKFTELEMQDLLEEYEVEQLQLADLATRALAITNGEPLFARFVCQEIAEAHDREAVIERLAKDPPKDVEEYFDRQFQQLDALAEGDLAWDILGMLIAALGGMTLDEIAEALSVGKHRVREALKPIRRFLLGKTRMELMHLQLRKVVSEEFSADERAVYRQKLLDWCRTYQGKNWPKGTPDYILDRYALHLVEGGQTEALYALIDKPWMDIQFERKKSYASFANDLNLAIALAKKQDPPNLVQEARLYFIACMLGSASANTSTTLLKAMAELGDPDRALEYAYLIKDARLRNNALCDIAVVLSSLGRKKDAETLLKNTFAEQTGDFRETWQRLAKIIRSLASAGELARAAEVASDILAHHGSDPTNSGALGWFAIELARMGMSETALKCVEKIPDYEKGRIMAAVLGSLAESGRSRVALEAADRLFSPNYSPFYRIPVLSAVANGLINEGHHTLAREVAVSCVTVAESVPEDDVYVGHFLAQAAGALARTGDEARAASMAARAVAWAGGAAKLRYAPKALVGTARGLAVADFVDLAQTVVDKLSFLEVERETIRVEMSGALRELARAVARIGDGARARKLTEEAVTLSWAEDTSYPEMALFRDEARQYMSDFVLKRDVITTLADRGKIDEALAIADTIRERDQQSQALASIGEALVRMGEIDRALSVAEGAEPLLAATVAAQVALRLNAQGEQKESVELVEKALRRARVPQWDFQWDYFHERLAGALAGCGDTISATQLVKVIKGPMYAARAMASTVAPLIQAGMHTQALDVANRATALAEKADRNYRPFSQLAEILARSGLEHLGKELALRAVEVSEPDSGLVVESKDQIFRKLADALLRAEQPGCAHRLTNQVANIRVEDRISEETAEIVKEAVEIAQVCIDNPMERVEVLSPFIPILSLAGYRKNAEVLADQLIAVSAKIADAYPRSIARSTLAYKLAEAGCGKHVVNVAQLMGEIKPHAAARVLSRCVVLIAAHGYFAQIMPMSIAALRHASMFPFSEYISCLGDITEALRIAGRYDDVRAVYQAVSGVEGWWWPAPT